MAIKILLNTNADVNKADEGGWTSLIIAAEKGHKEIVKLLLQAGATVDNNGDIALTIANHRRHNRAAIILLEANAQRRCCSIS